MLKAVPHDVLKMVRDLLYRHQTVFPPADPAEDPSVLDRDAVRTGLLIAIDPAALDTEELPLLGHPYFIGLKVRHLRQGRSVGRFRDLYGAFPEEFPAAVSGINRSILPAVAEFIRGHRLIPESLADTVDREPEDAPPADLLPDLLVGKLFLFRIFIRIETKECLKCLLHLLFLKHP